MTDLRHPLEPSAPEMEAMIRAVGERVVRHIESLPAQPLVYTEDPTPVIDSLREDLPESGTDLDSLLDTLFDKAVPLSYNTASPGYLAYIPGGGVFPAALADLIANAVNRYVGVWLAAPALVQIETNVVRWFCDLAGLPEGSGGLLTTGGSSAMLTALVAARRERLPENFLTGMLYTSDQAHHAVRKAAVLAGFPERNVRVLRSDDEFRLPAAALADRIREDRAEGLNPFLVVATAGTTNTGAVDDLPAIADLCEREGLWLHVDAAYGGFFLLTERGRRALRGVERADSIVLNPHKGLFLPYGNGALIVRDAGALRRTHSTFADYMPPMQEGGERVDYCELSHELSRDFRGLRVWLPLKMFGAEAFRACLDEKLDLARWVTDELEALPDIEILAEPSLSLVAFRLAPEGVDDEELDDLNRTLMERVVARQNVMLTGTVLKGRFALRICVLSHRTHLDRMEQCVEDLREAIAEITAATPSASRRGVVP